MNDGTMTLIFKGTQLLLIHGPGLLDAALKIKKLWENDPTKTFEVTVKEIRLSGDAADNEAIRVAKQWKTEKGLV